MGGWEGNRRSGVALATRHRLQWFIHLPAQGPRKREKYPAYTLLMEYGTPFFTSQYAVQDLRNGRVSVCPSVCLSRRSTADRKVLTTVNSKRLRDYAIETLENPARIIYSLFQSCDVEG